MKLFFILALMFLTLTCFAKEKYLILTDAHFYGPHALDKSILQKFKDSPIKNKISLGDNFDIKWTLKKDILQAKKEQKEFNEWCSKNCLANVQDNHGLIELTQKVFIKDGMCFEHGHLFLWDAKKLAKKEKSSSDGVSAFKRDIFGKGVKTKPYGTISKTDLKKAVDRAKSNKCTVELFGHVHVKEMFDSLSEGVRVLSFQRGLTEIEL